MKHILILFGDSRELSDKTTNALIHAANQLNDNDSLQITGYINGLIQGGETRTHVSNLISAGLTVITDHDSLPPSAILGRAHKICSSLNPKYVIAANTVSGTSIIPGLAVKNKADCITGVKKIIRSDTNTSFIKPVLNGRYDIRYNKKNASVYFTIQPESFKPENSIHHDKNDTTVTTVTAFKSTENIETLLKSLSAPGVLEMGPIDVQNNDVIITEQISKKPGNALSLSEARVIVCAGRGIDKKENIQTVKNFSTLFNQSTIAGSRPVIDDGWLGYSHQVGITGKKVSPDIYIALGVSGSSQHLAGIKNAGIIVAVNHHPEASIFKESDICIIADLFEFMDCFHKIWSQNTGTE